MTGRCKDCKHWRPNYGGHEVRRRCDMLSNTSQIGVREATDTRDLPRGECSIDTMPDFGCVLFEATS